MPQYAAVRPADAFRQCPAIPGRHFAERTSGLPGPVSAYRLRARPASAAGFSIDATAAAEYRLPDGVT